MKIAVACGPDGDVFPGFGRAPRLAVYDVEDGRVVASNMVETPEHGHAAHVEAAIAAGASAVICDNLGMPAAMGVKSAGMELYTGITGSADEAARAFAAGTLPHNEQAHQGGFGN